MIKTDDRLLRKKTTCPSGMGKVWLYLVVGGPYNDYYTLKEIYDFPGRKIGMQGLRARLNMVCDGSSEFDTAYQAIMANAKTKGSPFKRKTKLEMFLIKPEPVPPPALKLQDADSIIKELLTYVRNFVPWEPPPSILKQNKRKGR